MPCHTTPYATISQSGAIVRHLERRCNPPPKPVKENHGQRNRTIRRKNRKEARIDELYEASQDLSIVTRLMNFPSLPPQPGVESLDSLLKRASFHLMYLDNTVLDGSGRQSNKFKAKHPWLVEGLDKPTYADFGWYHTLDCIRNVDVENKTGLKEMDNIQRFMEHIEGIDRIGKYLEERPELEVLGENYKGSKRDFVVDEGAEGFELKGGKLV